METTKAISLNKSETPPEQQLYDLSFFDKELQNSRRLLLRTLVLPILYTSLLMWACLSLFWGSTVPSKLHKLSAYAIDLHGGDLGQKLLQGIDALSREPVDTLGWRFDTSVTSDALSKDLLLDERAWAVVQVNPNASSNLETALYTGDLSYNAMSAVTIYYSSARNQITTNSKVLPALLAALNPLLGKLGAENTAAFLSKNAGNVTAIQTALQCHSCLSSPYAAQQVDLHPFDVPQATGSTMVGLIFLLTFTFSVFQILHLNGELIGSRLNLRSALAFRLLSAISAYFIIALWYSLINLAFGVPMNRRFGNGGFVVYWMLNAFTMAALGLPMESLFTIIGLKWAGYFLSFWIIVNVSGAFTSFDLMPGFYQYGYAFPFFNSIQGARTIIFGTKNHLGRNFGILIAWSVVGILGMLVLTAWTLKENRKKRTHVLR